MKADLKMLPSKTPSIFGILSLMLLAVLIQACQPAPATATIVAFPAEVSVQQAAQKRAQGAFILDVREKEEWNQGHIPNATLIPLGELEKRLNEVPKDREVVVVCRSGNRSATGRDVLRKAGLNLTTSMAGGMNQWAAQGLPTVTGP
jgi:rhodanese-related sulfurtransferase